MTSVAWLLAPPMAPFSISIGIVDGLFSLEIVALLVGGSLLGMDGDGPAVGHDAGADTFDGADLEGPEPGVPDTDGPDPDAADLDADGLGDHDAVPQSGGGVLSWLGLGEVPFVIWFAGMLSAFDLAGYVLQLGALSVAGAMIPAAPAAFLAAFLAAVPALWSGRWVARGIGRMGPKTHSEAVSQHHLGGRRGLVTTGTAEVGCPAQAQVTERYGNIQYLRVEPLHEGQALAQGTEIVVMWGRGPVYQAIALDDPQSETILSKDS